ncbi:MAG TPA: TetR/AcrR family transcriptional regulator [Acidimicrobiia bacterium]|nr:TetR/AcrR family transcriptional regulator [Acidimicrobiia bacterium]
MTEVAAPRWQRRPEARRDELLDAAQRLFTRHGLAQTSVADIAAEAGVAKGSVYRYFESKEALLSALKDRFFERMMERVTAVVAAMPDAGFFELADAAIDATTRLLFAEADLVELWSQGTAPERGDEFARGIALLASTYEAGIRDAVADGRVDCADPRTTSLLLVYAVQGTATHAILNGGGPTPDEVIAAAQTMTRRVLGPPAR